MNYSGLIQIQTWNFLHLLRQEIKVPLLRLMRSTLSQRYHKTVALVWITTRISLPQSTRNLGEIVVFATAANISRRSGGAFIRTLPVLFLGDIDSLKMAPVTCCVSE